jgi:photosystem II stability/assembly factor-like uncharacterized protein
LFFIDQKLELSNMIAEKGWIVRDSNVIVERDEQSHNNEPQGVQRTWESELTEVRYNTETQIHWIETLESGSNVTIERARAWAKHPLHSFSTEGGVQIDWRNAHSPIDKAQNET